MQLGEIAKALDLPLEGASDLEIRGLAGLEDAGSGDLSFAQGERYRSAFAGSGAAAFLLPPDFDADGRPCLRTLTPYVDFGRAVDLMLPPPAAQVGIHPTAVVPESAVLGDGASVGAYCVIGENSRIGARSRLHPHVVVYPDCEIGEDCEIHSGAHIRENVVLGSRVVVQNGAVIGAEGFGFAFRPDGTRARIPHRSGVVVADEVEIGANTTVDASHPGHPRRGHETSATYLGRAAKIDNLVQVAHGCAVGEHATLCSGVGLAGRTEIGRRVLMAGGSATSGDLTVADGTVVLGMSGIMRDTEPGDQLVGVPARPRREFFRVFAATGRLPELLRRVTRLEGRLDAGGERE